MKVLFNEPVNITSGSTIKTKINKTTGEEFSYLSLSADKLSAMFGHSGVLGNPATYSEATGNLVFKSPSVDASKIKSVATGANANLVGEWDPSGAVCLEPSGPAPHILSITESYFPFGNQTFMDVVVKFSEPVVATAEYNLKLQVVSDGTLLGSNGSTNPDELSFSAMINVPYSGDVQMKFVLPLVSGTTIKNQLGQDFDLNGTF